jgi:hypothetical protein
MSGQTGGSAGAVEVREWLWYLGAGGFGATISYTLLSILSGPDWVGVVLAFSFAATLSFGSVAIWQVLKLNGSAGALAMLAAIANIVAGALFVSMALVQLAVRDVADPPDEALRAVYWGLDVAWDLYIGAGTLGFAIVFLHSNLFRWFAVPGAAIALLLLGLNVASFPEPPADAGLVDVGPLVGMWYLAVTLRAITAKRLGLLLQET